MADHKKTLLVVGAGIEALPGIKIAQSMGLFVVATDGAVDAAGANVADDFILSSTYDLKGTAEKACDYHTNVRPIDGVIAVASDIPHTVAAVANKLGLAGNSLETALTSIDKVHMKQAFQKDKVAIPQYYELTTLPQLEEVLSAKPTTAHILKPADSRGARGVIRLLPDVDINWAFDEALSHSPTKRLILEEFIEGPQISTESLVIDGICHTFGFSDRNYQRIKEYAPFMIEDGGELPANISPILRQDICDLVQQAATSLGARTGVVKGDIVIHQGKPMIIEMATRLSGGHFCTMEIPYSTGIPFVENAIKLALSEKLTTDDLTPYENEKHLCQRYLFTKPGIIKTISGHESWQENPSLIHHELRVKEGDIIKATTDHTCRVGMVIAKGQSHEDAIKNAEKAIANIHFTYVNTD